MIYKTDGTAFEIKKVVDGMSDEEVKEVLNILLEDREIEIKMISKEQKEKLKIIYNIKSGAILQKPLGSEVVSMQERIAKRELALLREILEQKDDREKLIDLLIFIWDEMYYLYSSSIYSDIALDYILEKKWNEVRDDLDAIIKEHMAWDSQNIQEVKNGKKK